MFWAVFKMGYMHWITYAIYTEQQKNMLVKVLCFLGSEFEMGRLEKNGILNDELVVLGSILFLQLPCWWISPGGLEPELWYETIEQLPTLPYWEVYKVHSLFPEAVSISKMGRQ